MIKLKFLSNNLNYLQSYKNIVLKNPKKFYKMQLNILIKTERHITVNIKKLVYYKITIKNGLYIKIINSSNIKECIHS